MKKPIPGRLLCRYESPAGDDLLVEIVERSPVQSQILVPAVPEPMAVWIASGAAAIRKKPLGGDWLTVEVRQGDFFLTAAPLPITMSWHSTSPEPLVFMHVYLGMPLVGRTVREATGHALGEFSLRNVSGGRDPVVAGILSSMYLALSAPLAPPDAFLQGLAQALCAHAVQHYAQAEDVVGRARGSLPPHRLHQVIQSMHGAFAQPFDLNAYAAIAELSAFHFSRLFKHATGMSPSHYVVWLRVEEARRLLRETHRPVIDIGMELGYHSPSHFTQVFREFTGTTPSSYRIGIQGAQ